jgi:hypothetical protein
MPRPALAKVDASVALQTSSGTRRRSSRMRSKLGIPASSQATASLSNECRFYISQPFELTNYKNC